jgi:catechol 2,3-dioxygenase
VLETYTLPAETTIGHVHLKVSDLGRSIAFYRDVLGFTLRADGRAVGLPAAFLAAGSYHHHIGLNTFESAGGTPPTASSTGLYHLAIRLPNRLSLARATARVVACGGRVDSGRDHGATVSVYLRDPDANGIELYYDRTEADWYDPSGRPVLKNEPFDPNTLAAEAAVQLVQA